MKKMRKFTSLLMAMIMVLALSANVFAASGVNGDTGKITVTGTVANQIYTPYQILILESYNTTSGAFTYKAHPDWEAWLKTQTTYISIASDGVVSWVGNASAAAFARAAMAHIDVVNGDDDPDNNIAPAATAQTAAQDNAVLVFDGLNLGYYLIDSSLGALCTLDTTKPEVTVAEKNSETKISKKVNEGTTNVAAPAGYNYVEEVTKRIGEIIDFATMVYIEPGAENYVYHDSMDAGLTYINTATYPTEVWEYPMDDPDTEPLVLGTDYTISTAECIHSDGKECTFTITFSEAYLKSVVDTGATVTIRYFTELNENALTYHEDEDGNINYAKLTYGHNSETEWDTAVVKTYGFELVKTDVYDKVLTGAKFALYDAATGGNLIPLVKDDPKEFIVTEIDGVTPKLDDNQQPIKETLDVYRPATAAQIAAKRQADATWTTDEIEVGRAVIEGLALEKTYYLEETAQPSGYNKLTERVPAKISQSTTTGQVMVNGSADHMSVVIEDVYYSGGVQVENRTGTILPSTGGIGTTIFYVLGSIFTVGALILFITKRRMIIEN